VYAETAFVIDAGLTGLAGVGAAKVMGEATTNDG
jgi:hypothetical protein